MHRKGGSGNARCVRGRVANRPWSGALLGTPAAFSHFHFTCRLATPHRTKPSSAFIRLALLGAHFSDLNLSHRNDRVLSNVKLMTSLRFTPAGNKTLWPTSQLPFFSNMQLKKMARKILRWCVFDVECGSSVRSLI